MAHWCHPKYSTSGKWRLPYPRESWLEEQDWNGFLLDAMTYALTADAVFSTSGEDWGENEIVFYNTYLLHLESLEL